MDDLIVIILTLIIAGAGVIGQLRKKKQQSELPEGQKNSGDIWDLLNDGIFPEEDKNEPESVPTEYVEEPESVPYVNEQKYNFEPENEGGGSINKTPIRKSDEVKQEIKTKEKFSLRKAVIYSEILNRKYK